MLRCFQITLDGLESFPQISRNLSPPLSQLSEGRLDDR
jgi:hypothetical protein